MSIILVIFAVTFCILTIISIGYILIKKINSSEHDGYAIVVLQCMNIDCKNNGIKEFRYDVSVDKFADILFCPECNKTRELILKK